MRSTKQVKYTILLVGFMGSGKSTVGRRLAHRLGGRFVDLDRALAARAGKTVRRVFRERGEAWFRTLETRVLRQELRRARGVTVFAAGGGLPLKAENRALARRARAVVVWLDPSWTVLWKRLRRQRGRPLLLDEAGHPKPERELRHLWNERRSAYRKFARFRVVVRAKERVANTVERTVAAVLP
jgi:shikimate kinase